MGWFEENQGCKSGLEAAEVGSDVMVTESGGVGSIARAKLHKVTAAGKMKVKLDDGSEWARRGGRWGVSRDAWHRGPSASLVVNLDKAKAHVEGLQAERRLANARYKVREVVSENWRKLTMDQCTAIWEIVKPKEEAHD